MGYTFFTASILSFSAGGTITGTTALTTTLDIFKKIKIILRPIASNLPRKQIQGEQKLPKQSK